MENHFLYSNNTTFMVLLFAFDDVVFLFVNDWREKRFDISPPMSLVKIKYMYKKSEENKVFFFHLGPTEAEFIPSLAI